MTLEELVGAVGVMELNVSLDRETGAWSATVQCLDDIWVSGTQITPTDSPAQTIRGVLEGALRERVLRKAER